MWALLPVKKGFLQLSVATTVFVAVRCDSVSGAAVVGPLKTAAARQQIFRLIVPFYMVKKGSILG